MMDVTTYVEEECRPNGLPSELKAVRTALLRCAPTSIIAEGEGFEPSVTQGATPVFETDPFNHSGTPPGGREATTRPAAVL